VARGALRALNKYHFYTEGGLLHQQDVMPIFNLLLSPRDVMPLR
jgi:hypothetical protein